MIEHKEISDRILIKLIKGRSIRLAGHKKLKIYGYLNCSSGKRMNSKYRVFFTSEAEAINEGFRPCGNCMKEKYNRWISSIN